MSKNSPAKKRQQSPKNRTAQLVSAEYSGPIPPPAHLDHYEAILPGAAERILTLAEGEAEHRREIEKGALAAEIMIATREKNQVAGGQWFAFIITLAFIFVGGFLVYAGNPVPGTLLSLTGLVGIVSAFLKKEPQKK